MEVVNKMGDYGKANKIIIHPPLPLRNGNGLNQNNMHTILNAEVSVFENYMNAKPFANMTLYKWLSCTGYKEEVEALRRQKSLEKVKDIKMQLPAITPSGVFEGKRALHTLNAHSGFICVDIDGKDNPDVKDWNSVKHNLGSCKNIAYSGLSVSGRGIFVIIPIAYPEKHIEHFHAIEHYFLEKHHINIDKGCKDVCRLRGISYDDTAYFNHNAEPMLICLQSANTAPLRHDNPPPDNIVVREVLNDVMSLKADITENYHDWFSIGCVIANAYGEKGRIMYHDISKLSNKYKCSDCDRQYTACLKTKYSYSVGTLVHLLNKYR